MELSTRMVRVEESQLASLIADAARSAAGSDVALLTAIGFHEVTLARGTQDSGEICRALANPDDRIVLVRLSGAQIRRALAHGMSLHPQRNPAFLQVSGLTLTIQSQPGQDAQIVSIKVGKEPLDETREYTVAMPMPLAHGHLGYARIWDRTAIQRETRYTLQAAVEEYCSSLRAVTEKHEPRIVFRKSGEK